MARPQLARIHAGAATEAADSGLGSTWLEFRKCLSEIRRNDFYWSRGELETNVAAAAVPLFHAEGEVAAALALVGLHESLDAVGDDGLKSLLVDARDYIHRRIAQGMVLPAAPPAGT